MKGLRNAFNRLSPRKTTSQANQSPQKSPTILGLRGSKKSKKDGDDDSFLQDGAEADVIDPPTVNRASHQILTTHRTSKSSSLPPSFDCSHKIATSGSSLLPTDGQGNGDGDKSNTSSSSPLLATSKKYESKNNQPTQTQKQNIKKLLDTTPTRFIEELTKHIYNNDNNSKRDHPKIQIGQSNVSETVYNFEQNICSVDTSTLLPDGDGVVHTVIPVSAFANGLQIGGNKTTSLESEWDKDQDERDEKISKDEENNPIYDLTERLQMVNTHVTNESTARWFKNMQGFNFGLHDERKYSIKTRMRVTDDKESIYIASNTLVVICFVKKNNGKYSIEKSEQVEMSPATRLYYDNEQVMADDVKCSYFLKNNKLRVYTSRTVQHKIRGRGYKTGTIAFVRVADLLTKDEITRIFQSCSEYKHAIPVFIWICCSHRVNQYFLKEEEDEDSAMVKDNTEQAAEQVGDEDDNNNDDNNNKKKKKKKKEEEKEKQIKMTLQLATKLMKEIKHQLIWNYWRLNSMDLERMSWDTWSGAKKEHDKLYEQKERQRRQRHRKRMIRDYKSHYKFSDESMILEEVRLFQCFMIMLITQQSSDVDSSEWMFRRVSYGYTTPRSYLGALKKMSYSNLLEVFIELCRSKALYTQRASSLLRSFVIIEILHQGRVPRTFNELNAFKQMEKKKCHITLNTALGEYLALGADVHVINLIMACGVACGCGKLSTRDIIEITKRMDEDPGAFFNEIAAEIAQAFDDWEKRNAWKSWYIIIGKVINKDKQYDAAISEWLGQDWSEEYRVGE
jgi:endonuclease III